MERCKHVKSQANTVYFKLGTLRRVSTYVQHVWGIIGHVTAEAANTAGTDGAPPHTYDLYGPVSKVTGRQLPPLSSVLYGIISKRRSVLAAQLILRKKSGA